METNVGEKCCREVLWRGVVEKFCREVFWRIGVKEGCRQVLWRDKCCGEVS